MPEFPLSSDIIALRLTLNIYRPRISGPRRWATVETTQFSVQLSFRPDGNKLAKQWCMIALAITIAPSHLVLIISHNNIRTILMLAGQELVN